MKALGTTKVKIAKLVLPGDMASRQKTDGVVALSRSLDTVGLLERPKIRKSDMTPVTGRDRIAAHMLAGREDLEVEMVDCTDEEAEKIDAISNAMRRHDKDEQRRLITRLVDIREQEIARQPQEKSAERGRPKTARAKAREDVAKITGTKPESVRMAEYRNKKSGSNKAPPIHTFGLDLSDEFEKEVCTLKGYAIGARKSLDRLLTDLDALRRLDDDTISSHVTRLVQLRGIVGEMTPVSLCPFCKCLIEGCMFCADRGWIGRGVDMSKVPTELLSEGDDACVMDGGETVLVSEFE